MVTWLFKQLYRLLRFLTSRLVVFSVLILIQVAILVVVLLRLSVYSLWIFGLFYLISIAVVIWIVAKEDNPSYKIAWIVFVMAFPILGGLFYLSFGNKNIPKRKKREFTDYLTQNAPLFTAEEGALTQVAEKGPEYLTQALYLQRVSGFPPCANTSVEYCPLGQDQFRVMLEELPKAERFIFMEYFIIEAGKMWDPILEILKEKVAQGVEVRLMYDDMGCIQTLPENYSKQLEGFGLKVKVFNPFRPSIDPYMNYRDHRKICVIDGKVGICGGINLADEYINAYEKHGHWKDTAVVLRGDAVWNLTRMFLQVWGVAAKEPCPDFLQYRVENHVQAPGFVQPYSDSPLDEFRVAESVYMQIVNRANRYVYITTPYLILDSEFITALKMAAQSGIDVRIVTPHVADKWFVHMVTRSNYLPLLRSGVKIYEYTPGFIHAKMFVSDDNCAVVGTANLDYRSLYLHHECAVTIVDNPAVNEVRDDILKTIQISQEVTIEELKSQGLLARIVAALLKNFAPLM